MGEIDPSTALEPRPSISLGVLRLSKGSGSSLSELRAEARGSRWVDTETGEGYRLARHGIVKPLQDNRAFAEALLFAQRD